MVFQLQNSRNDAQNLNQNVVSKFNLIHCEQYLDINLNDGYKVVLVHISGQMCFPLSASP